MFERFTEKALRVILLAQEESRRTGHNFVGTEQIVLGLIGEGTGIGSRALRNCDIKLADARREVERLIGKGTGFVSVEIPFTPRAKSILEQSLQQARAFNHSYIGTEHMLLALLEDDEGVAAQLLLNLKVDIEKVRRFLLQEIGELADAAGLAIKKREQEIERKIQEIIDNDRKKAEQEAEDELNRRAKIDEFKRRMTSKIPDIDIEAIFQETEEKKRKLREQLRAKFDTDDFRTFFRKELDDIFEEEKVEPVSVETPTLNEFTTNLSAMVEEGSIDPVIGRDKEVERVTQILSRRRKNNPVLIGEPGVGKTAVAEGLALKIANQDITQGLANKEVAVLDVGLLIAGTKYRGEFEERIKRIMEEVKRKRTLILVIDEIHTIIGAGSAEGSLDAANILKPALARGELQCIGATTLDEYRTIEKDPALARRFQPVYVDEPSQGETLIILQGLRKSYEGFHNVRLPDLTLKKSIEMSTGYIKDRFLPDKAIDLIDEAAARVKIISTRNSHPTIKGFEKDLQEILADKDRALRGQDFELAASIRDREMTLRTRMTAMLKTHNASEEEIERQKYLPVVQEEHVADVISSWTGIPLNKIGSAEADKLLRMERELHERVIGQEEAVTKISNAVKRSRVGIASPDRPIASFLFCGPTGVGKTEVTKALGDYFFGSADSMIRFDMSEYMERHTVARLIGSPPGYVGYNEGGQLTEAVRRRPFSLVLFDEVEKAHPDIFNLLLQVLDDGRLTDSQGKVIDFTNTIIVMTSNLGSKHLDAHFNKDVNIVDSDSDENDSNTIGSNIDEYKDYKVSEFFWEDYQEEVKKDIKEKEAKLAEMDPSDEAYNAEMAQQLEKDINSYYEYEKQQIEDQKFNDIDEDDSDIDSDGDEKDNEVRELVMGEVKSFFRPEFVNRIDEIIVFHPLRKSDITQILEILLNQLSKRLRKKNIVLHVDDDAKKILIDEGFDPVFGARPLRRAIQRNIENLAAQAVLETPVKTIRSLLLAVKDPFDFRNKKPKIKLFVFPLPSFILNKFDKNIIDNAYNEKAMGFYANIVKGWLKEGGPYIERRLGRYYEYDTSFVEIPSREELAVQYAIERSKRPLTREELIGKGPKPDWEDPWAN